MFTVVVTDYTFPTLDIEEKILAPVGASLIAEQCKTPERLIPLVKNADAVITQFAPVNADVIAAMNQVRVIARYGIGVDNVDLESARSRGIPVCNVPDYCIDEVADHTLAFILASTRQVIPNCLRVRAGSWGLSTPLDQMRTLRDLTIGIVGFGRIGREVASRLAGFRCRRLVHDPIVDESEVRTEGCQPASFDELLASSDVVTLHCPSLPSTRQLINARSIALMKPGAILVNLARGDLVETGSLIRALETGKLSAAALDVCDPEPIPLDSLLRSLPNVITASHVASASVRAVRELRETVAGIVAAALRGEPLPNVVNGVR